MDDNGILSFDLADNFITFHDKKDLIGAYKLLDESFEKYPKDFNGILFIILDSLNKNDRFYRLLMERYIHLWTHGNY